MRNNDSTGVVFSQNYLTVTVSTTTGAVITETNLLYSTKYLFMLAIICINKKCFMFEFFML